jgi:hypothetical protein
MTQAFRYQWDRRERKSAGTGVGRSPSIGRGAETGGMLTAAGGDPEIPGGGRVGASLVESRFVG